MPMDVIVFMIFIFLLFGGYQSIESFVKQKWNKVRKLAPHEYEWGDGKDLSELLAALQAIENLLPEEISDSVFKRIEQEWEKEHPDPIKVLQDKLAEKDARIQELKAKAQDLDNQIMKYKYYVTRQKIPNTALKQMTEAEIRSVLKLSFEEMVKTAQFPDSGIITVPSMGYKAPVSMSPDEFSKEDFVLAAKAVRKYGHLEVADMIDEYVDSHYYHIGD